MIVSAYHYAHDAFGAVERQCSATVDGKFYRIFGELKGIRRVRIVMSATRQPRIESRKEVEKILAAVDAYVAANNLKIKE